MPSQSCEMGARLYATREQRRNLSLVRNTTRAERAYGTRVRAPLRVTLGPQVYIVNPWAI